jgi:hypothetical protein
MLQEQVMIRTKNLTLSVLAALGIGLAGPGVAGSGYGHSASSAMPSNAEPVSDASRFSTGSFQGDGSLTSSQSDSTAMSETGSEIAFSDSGTLLTNEASAADQSLYVLASEPTLLFSDGVWYSFTDGDWYALDDSGAWYSIADASDYAYSDYSYYHGSDAYAAFQGSDAYAYSDSSLDTSDAYAFDGSQADVVADASDAEWYYVSEAPQDELVLYSTDGVAWYSMDDELIALAPVEATEDASIPGPIASSTTTYYYFM